MDFVKSQLVPGFFDSIVAFNVNFFWKNPLQELLIIKNSIKPNGKLYVFQQAPFEISIKDAEPIKEKLLEHSFDVLDVKFKKLVPTSAFCVVSKPKKANDVD